MDMEHHLVADHVRRMIDVVYELGKYAERTENGDKLAKLSAAASVSYKRTMYDDPLAVFNFKGTWVLWSTDLSSLDSGDMPILYPGARFFMAR